MTVSWLQLLAGPVLSQAELKALLLSFAALGQSAGGGGLPDPEASCAAAIRAAAEDQVAAAKIWSQGMVCEGGACDGEALTGDLAQSASDAAAAQGARAGALEAKLSAYPPQADNSVCMELTLTEAGRFALDGAPLAPEDVLTTVEAKASASGIRYSRLVVRHGGALSPDQVMALNTELLTTGVTQLTTRE